MSETGEVTTSMRPITKWSRWFATKLGVSSQRKEEIYLELSKSATLHDPAYWLQLIFAAGIATLGLVLNSPAVIIGAMLISPLMGPILASGLAFAAGDLILGLRAVGILTLSCLAAIIFSVLLVGLLPFKEMTAEIAARTQPNTLDLAVALFSGAVGSLAICKEVKGVVTSIPGVAIAVALMPPLCVVGYGFGLALSLDRAGGLRAALGGGLLFLTNLVAITFTAMVVFLALRIGSRSAREKALEWRQTDAESERVQSIIRYLRIPERVGTIGGIWGRFLIILIPFLLLLIPLSRSLGQLKQEYATKRQENNVRRIATDYWQRQFATLPDGSQRAVLDRMVISDASGKVTLALRVFTSQPFTPAERSEYTRLVATRLGKPPDAVEVNLLEIPTAASLLAVRARESERIEAPPNLAQLRASFGQGVQAALNGLRLPPPARVIDYQVVTSSAGTLGVDIYYLGDHEITADAQALISEDVRTRLNDPAAVIKCTRILDTFDTESIPRNQTALTAALTGSIDRAGEILQQHPQLQIEVASNQEERERAGVAEARAQAVGDYLATKWQIARGRIHVTNGKGLKRTISLRIKTVA